MDEMSGRSEVKWMWAVGRRMSTRGETRQTEQERIRNRRAGSRRERESRAQGRRRAANRPRRPTRLAQLGDSFRPSFRLLHAQRSAWRRFGPGTLRKAKRKGATRSEKRSACMMHVMHTCRSSLVRSEHRKGPQRSRHVSCQNRASQYRKYNTGHRCRDRVDG